MNNTIDLAAFGPPYKARQPAQCSACAAQIQPGDMQRGDGDSQTICSRCGANAARPTPRADLRPARILRHLIAVNGTGATSRTIAEAIGEPAGKRSLITVGTTLTHAELEGHVARTGVQPRRGRAAAAVIWAATPEGRAWLAQLDAAERRRREPHVVRTRVRAWRQRMIADTRASLPADLDHAERQRIARSLRCQGLHLVDIGDVFGITRERARQILS